VTRKDKFRDPEFPSAACASLTEIETCAGRATAEPANDTAPASTANVTASGFI
jgi:hypothetical protein